jgi:hypothetical protein
MPKRAHRDAIAVNLHLVAQEEPQRWGKRSCPESKSNNAAELEQKTER